MVDLGVREKIQMQMVEEGWKRKWHNVTPQNSKFWNVTKNLLNYKTLYQ
jgi:hypothetical protein